MKTQQSFTYHDPNGRGTVVGVVLENQLVFGIAMRNYRDQFSRKLGRIIAVGRAMKRPCDWMDISGYTDSVAQAFYTKAPELIEKKREEIVARQVI